MATEKGEDEKVKAMAREIAKTLGHDESMAADILHIFSSLDGRQYSRDKFTPHDFTQTNDDFSRVLKSLERQITPYLSSDRPIWSDSADSSAFLDSVDDLISAFRDGALPSRADDLLNRTLFRLADEFRFLLDHGGESFDVFCHRSFGEGDRLVEDEEEEEEEDHDSDQIPVAQPLTDYDVVIDALPSSTISDLHEIVKRMAAGGFEKDCCHVYGQSRREFLDESMERLGFRKWSIEEVQKLQWQEVEEEVDKWIKASNVALRILFPSERRLCDRVFFGFSQLADLGFMEVCRGTAVQILNFADAVAIGSRAPDRLFKVLDVFECLRDLIPEFESNFSDHYCIGFRNDAFTIWNRVGDAIRGIFMELENLIRRDPAKGEVPQGGLHPITRYVINYIIAACRSRETLEQVFQEAVAGGVVSQLRKDSVSSSLVVQMEWILELLESNLEMKSKIYGDPASSAVFMMNNKQYIVQKVKDSELVLLLGDDWVWKHNAKIKQLILNYQRSSWNKVLGVLKADTGSSAVGSNKSISMKEKIRFFNQYLEDVCKTHSQWIIFDEQLRKEVHIYLSKHILPAYASFLGRFKNASDVGKHADKYIKYSEDDIDAKISELFRGSSSSAAARSRK